MIYSFRSTAVKADIEKFKEVCKNVKASSPVTVKYYDDGKVSFECLGLIPASRGFFRELAKTIEDTITIAMIRNGNTSCTFKVTPKGDISEV